MSGPCSCTSERQRGETETDPVLEVPTAQLVEPWVPVCVTVVGCVQVPAVCRLIWLYWARFCCSMMSISPAWHQHQGESGATYLQRAT